MQQWHTSQHDENVKHPLHCYTNALFLLRRASLHNASGGWQTTMFRSHLVWWACHNRSTEDAVVADIHNCCATWNIYIYLFVCFWAMVDVIVSLCDNWPPPPCSRLHGSLQCCSLLNYYQWVWRDTCCLAFLSLSPSWQPLSNTNTRRRAACISFDMGLLDVNAPKGTGSILCKRQWGQSMLSRAYSRLTGITLQHGQRSTYADAWMHSSAHTNTDASLQPLQVGLFVVSFAYFPL